MVRRVEAQRREDAVRAGRFVTDARAEGFGQIAVPRMSLMASQVSDAYGTKTRVDPIAVWNGSFLPSAAELNVLPPAKK